MKDEQKLLFNLKKKKRGSLENVIDIYTPYVSVIVYNIIGSQMTREDVEEVVSDVFISLWRNAENLDINKGCIRTYIGTSARNLAKNKLRKLNDYMELNESLVALKEEPYMSLEKKEEQKSLMNLILELGEPDSEIFMRYYYYEEKISKISEVMGINISTIKTKLLRGRKRLKEVLASERGYGSE